MIDIIYGFSSGAGVGPGNVPLGVPGSQIYAAARRAGRLEAIAVTNDTGLVLDIQKSSDGGSTWVTLTRYSLIPSGVGNPYLPVLFALDETSLVSVGDILQLVVGGSGTIGPIAVLARIIDV